MQVYVQDYGVIDFRPEEVYRFDGRTDMTQLRGSIRTNSNNDWVKHDYWYDLRDILVAHSNDLNLVIGLPVLTRADLDKEQQENHLCNKCGKPLSECGEDSCVNEQNKLVEKIIGLKEGKLLVCGVHTKPGGVSWGEFYQFLKDVKVIDLTAPTRWVAGEGLKLEEQADGNIVVSLVDEDHAFSQWQASIDVDNNTKLDVDAADDTDIEEEIQRVLQAMRELDLKFSNELDHYKKLTTVLGQLKQIQTYS